VYIKKISLTDPAYVQLAARLGSIFNAPSWLTIFGERLQLFGIFTADHELSGSFFLLKDKKIGFSFFHSPSYTPHNGCFFENKAQNPSKALSQEKKVIECIAGFFDTLPGIISVAFPPERKDMQPFTWKKFKTVPHYTYRLPLSETVEQLDKRMSAEHRNLLKKGIKDGLTVKQVTDFSIVKSMVLKTFDRKNKSIDDTLLDKITSGFANETNSIAFAAFDNERPVAASLVIHDKETAYYLLSGYDPEVKHSGAGIICLWQSILFSKESGLKIFDFEGSMLPEVERFFRGFGPELVPYYSVNKASLPLEFMLKMVKREQF
jgi:lipid II:glycine glycyltransferase (peptidoglycan interpeptide bridge formation enzyme)